MVVDFAWLVLVAPLGKQLVDLLRQIEEVAATEIGGQVRAGREAILRGVVAYTGV